MIKSKEELPPITKDYALIAQAVYDPDQKTAGEWSRLSDEKLKKLDIEPDSLQDSKSNFKAGIYENKKGDLVVAFAGTENLKDWKTNLKQGVGLNDRQYDLAQRVGNEIREKLADKNVVLTGHSLGGGLAATASAVSERKAVTFNAAGVHGKTLKRGGVDPKAFEKKAKGGQISNIIVKNELLNHKVQRLSLIHI